MIKRMLFLFIAFIAFLVMVMIGEEFIRPTSLGRVRSLNEGWDVQYNDTVYKNVKLSALRGIIGNSTEKGDKLVLTLEDLDLSVYSSPTLEFETRFSAWTVSCNNSSVSSKYFDHFDSYHFIGCENNFVALPASSEPIKLGIELLVSEDDAYNFYEAPVLGSYMDVLLYTVYDNLFVFLTSAFLIIFGVIFFAIAIGFKSDLPEINMQMYSALLFIILGIWFLTQFKLLDFFIDTRGHQTEMEYMSLYLVVPLMYMVMGSMRNYLKNKIFLVFAIAGSLFSFALIIVHFVSPIHINRLLGLYQVDAIILCIFMVVTLIRDSRKRNITPSQVVQLLGETMLSMSFIFNVIFYYFEVTGVSEQIMLSKKAVPMGTMCMAFATLVNYHIFISESYARKVEYDSLAHLAYADGLTGIPNRSKFEKYLGDIAKKKEDFCVISIDLNGLKTVNDEQGHLMGDRYLEEFGKALDECFSNKGFIARIGGDEFVCVLRGENMDQAEKLVEELRLLLDKMNREDPKIKRSMAAGFAYRHEVDNGEWNEVYLLADERMYKNKAVMKSNIA